MAANERISGILERLDQLNEFERQPVGEHQLQRGMYFAAAFAGEHIAATEFVIGALFVSLGAGAYDVLVGLILGNLLAVLSWTLICAPIAVQTRLTLYWYLRQIIGPAGMVVYNVVNAVLYCALGGAMITVAASALRIPFGIPDQVKWYPEDLRFVLVVFVIGAVVVTLAILGFKRLAQFATVCSPWMIVMFVAGAIATLPLLGDARSVVGVLADRDRADLAGAGGEDRSDWLLAHRRVCLGVQSGDASGPDRHGAVPVREATGVRTVFIDRDVPGPLRFVDLRGNHGGGRRPWCLPSR